ncbi:MAG: hypothetical protein LWW86_09290 [Micrococcales bacterium]|nr:hypothetical protein [Micrococcales bacterium]
MGALGVLAWEYIRTSEVTNTGAVLVLLASGGLFAVLQRMFGAEAPRSVLGAELSTGPSPEEVATRRRSYALDAALFAVALLVLAIAGFAMGDTAALRDSLAFAASGPAVLALFAAIDLVVTFALFYAVNRFLGESAARAVERRLARLEAGA